MRDCLKILKGGTLLHNCLISFLHLLSYSFPAINAEGAYLVSLLSFCVLFCFLVLCVIEFMPGSMLLVILILPVVYYNKV